MWTFLTALALASTADQALAEGVAAQRSGNAQQAITAYSRCLELAPERSECHWELGWSYWTLGDWDHVVEHWRRVRTLQPTHPEVDRWLAEAETHLEGLERIRAAAARAPETLRSPLPPGKTLRIRAVGDIMMGSDYPDVVLPPEDGATMFASVGDWLRDADLTFGNLEGPLCDGGATNKCKPDSYCFAFRTPTRYAAWLEDAGFDLMSTANNHSGDFGSTCREQTQQTLDSHGIGWSGPPGTVASVERDGMRVALIAFHPSPRLNDLNDHETAKLLVKAADADHDLVIVSFHGGAEGNKHLHVPDEMEIFYGERRGHLRRFAREVVSAGADLVLGHGPHVPRGLEVVDGHLVAYSLGNFATYARFGLGGHLSTSLVLEVILDHEGKLVSGQILPVKQINRGIPIQDEAGTAIDLIRELTTEDFPETGPQIARDGTFAKP